MLERKAREDLYLTSECNNNCVFCPRNIIKHNIPVNLIKTMNSMRKHTERINLTGGEVTIADDFIDILKICKKLKYSKINIITNGRRFSDDKFSKAILSLKILNEIAVSIYSIDPEIHDHITRTEGSCWQTLKGLRNLLANKDISVRVNLNVSSLNYQDVYEALSYLEKLKIKNILLINIVGKYRAKASQQEHVLEQVSPLIRTEPGRVLIRGFDRALGDKYGDGFAFEGNYFNTYFNN
jgi:MoaA/NifB/PqqE/SkfB family radical SAM enzyme